MTFETIEKKWIKKWQDAKIFEARPAKKKKFFGTFPYPYVNSYLHLGHFYSSMKVEALARYKRMRGFNVLYAQAWHCTGSPIVSAARRIAAKEPKQIEILKIQGFKDDEIAEFSEPKKWVEYFPKEAKKDFFEMGYSIDWRREFITTELNPFYDKFIKWQFEKLKEKEYIIKGKFPVVWDPIENAPVGDHDRIHGEGETPQEYVLVKHKLDNKFVVTATLRPDTIMGITNLFVNPHSALVETKVDDEVWIISVKVANDLKYQDKKIKIIKTIKGSELIGNKVTGFSGRDVPILPANFVDETVGTGIVHAVPSDSADDLIALYDLQKDQLTCNKYGLDFNEVNKIVPIPVLKIPNYSDIPAEDIVKKLSINNQNEKDKLAKAKEILYKDGYYKGRLNNLYAKGFSKNYANQKVHEVKEDIKNEIINSEYGDVYYQLTGRVTARSLGECIVKIVDNQWFITYSNKFWKNLAHHCLESMQLYPEKTRSQFDYVIDWLRDWACTREFGLGTRLSWDPDWLIESLSDSTIYMAYYTISHKIKDINLKHINNDFFDYIFLGTVKAEPLKVKPSLAKELRKEFLYWYPMDFRNTGKDLIQNHMTFCIFNHVAIFPKKLWPLSFGLNGHVTVDGQKMSKSLGNFILMRQARKDYGADASRFTALSGGEGIDDANFDREFAKAMPVKLKTILDFARQFYNKGRSQKNSIDEWFDSKINEIIVSTTSYYEQQMFRSVIQTSYFEMQNVLKWYLRRTLNIPNKKSIKKYIETQTLLLAPIIPFICEETWETIGKKGFVSLAKWPRVPRKLSKDISEELIQQTLEDVYVLKSLIKFEPKRIIFVVAEKWKYELYAVLKRNLKKNRDFGSLIKIVMKDKTFQTHSKEVTQIIQKILKTGLNKILTRDKEYKALEESKDFFRKELKLPVKVLLAEESNESKLALPFKPGIILK